MDVTREPARWPLAWLGITLVLLVVALANSCSTTPGIVVIPNEIPGAHYVGNTACFHCHTNYVREFPASPPAQMHFVPDAKAGPSGCEACHGPGSKHIEVGGGRGKFIVNPGREAAACFQCHFETHAEFSLPQHHPVLEGKMNCVQCHDPHGADIMKPAGGLASSRLNQSCAQCHREQAKPFVHLRFDERPAPRSERAALASGLFPATQSRAWPRMTTLLIATRNAHKVGEIRTILGDGFRFLTLQDFSRAPEVVEDADTFGGNAMKKATELAHWAARASPGPRNAVPDFILADDSGLEVDALGGQPGVHSARFAALDSAQPGNSPDADNNAKLLHLLRDVPGEKRSARFRCVLALAPVLGDKVEVASPVCYADECEIQTQLFDGACEGRVLFAARGRGGFGYDPLFVPDGFDQSFAELGEDVKNRLSHRARALAKLKVHLAETA